MKKGLLLFSMFVLCAFSKSNATSFTVQHTTPSDTVYATYSGNSTINVEDSIVVTSGSVTLKWEVLSSNFPSDWIAGTGICDNFECYTMSSLYPIIATKTSGAYTSAAGDFHAQINLSSATSYGTYYIAVRMYDPATSDTANEVYAISYWPTAVPSVNNNTDVTLYPNPASNSVNVVYSPDAGIKVAAVYNMIGKMMVVNKVGASSANINIENLPSGVYFMRLVNGGGEIVATRKFTKE